jgi:hypothetical protein
VIISVAVGVSSDDDGDNDANNDGGILKIGTQFAAETGCWQIA